MQVIVCFSLLLLGVAALPFDPREETVEPEYLDKLLEEKRYEEFSEILGLGDPDLAHSKGGAPRSRHEAMMNKNLHHGDIMLTPLEREESRQVINFTRYGGSKWKDGYVPYVISNDFSNSQKQIIERGIGKWNNQISCLKFWPRRGESAYINFINGNGCWANLGRTGRAQSISLDVNGCLYDSVTLHEMQHAVGFAHEQNRMDRDRYIEMQWGNIPDEWKDQYKKTSSPDYTLKRSYDYYSIMHYPVNAPGTRKPAFRVLVGGIDERRIGNGDGFTTEDIKKICELYR